MRDEKKKVEQIVRAALKEDIGARDITTLALIPAGLKIKARIVSKEKGVVSGLAVCERVFGALDRDIKFKPQIKEGAHFNEGKVVAHLEGEARHILSGERTALNFLSFMSGIATKTNEFVNKVRAANVKIMDTRKTLPGLRYLEKYAVLAGGGYNHRETLSEQALIKDNHLKAAKFQPRAFGRMINDARKKIKKNIKIEIEVNTLEEFQEALEAKVDIIMLDNMSVESVKKAVQMREKSAKFPLIEVSGSINLQNVSEYAACGPDMISIGCLTHSVKSIDFSLEVDAAI